MRRIRSVLNRIAGEVAASKEGRDLVRKADGGLSVEVVRDGIRLVLRCDGVPRSPPGPDSHPKQRSEREAPAGSGDEDPADLTGREREVLELAAKGERNVDIARALSIQHSTVAAHLRSIYRKWGVNSRVELAKMYLTGGPSIN